VRTGGRQTPGCAGPGSVTAQTRRYLPEPTSSSTCQGWPDCSWEMRRPAAGELANSAQRAPMRGLAGQPQRGRKVGCGKNESEPCLAAAWPRPAARPSCSGNVTASRKLKFFEQTLCQTGTEHGLESGPRRPLVETEDALESGQVVEEPDRSPRVESFAESALRPVHEPCLVYRHGCHLRQGDSASPSRASPAWLRHGVAPPKSAVGSAISVVGL